VKGDEERRDKRKGGEGGGEVGGRGKPSVIF